MVFTTITVINQIWQLTSICANFLIRVETYKVEIRNSGKVHFLFFYAFFLNILTVICGNVWSSWRDSSNSLGITRRSGWGRSIRGWHVVTFTHFLCKLFSWTQKRHTPKKTRTSFLHKFAYAP